MFGAQALCAQGLSVTNHGLVQAACEGDLVQLMQFKPKAFRNRAVKLAGTNQRAAQAMGCTLQGNGKQLMPFAARLCSQACHDQFVANGQMVLQGLAKVSDLAWPLIQHDGLVEEVLFQLFADEVDFRSENFQ